MGQPIQRTDGSLQYPMAGLIVQARDQAKTAGVLFIGRLTQTPVPDARISAVEARFQSFTVPIYHVLRPYQTVPCR